MTDIFYGITETTYFLGEKHRTSYGIAVYAAADMEGIASVIASIPDMTCDRHRLEELICLCNSAGPSPFHLEDVIHDFFVE